eukprot:GHVU01173297.1.p1 GENE.GHVU01173297.1~~GHVU01173297.1.p1  ORF type:complete len:296 (-),score=38.63 GHVU01173297.1:147-1034(-)
MGIQKSVSLILVTGANRGIGEEIVKQLLKKAGDAKVVMTGRDQPSLEAARDAICRENPQAQGRLVAVKMDVGDDASVAAAYGKVSSLFPGEKLYALVNNAGVGLDLPWLPAPYPKDTARKTFEINVKGPLRTVRNFMPMFEKGTTRVITLSSVMAGMHVARAGPTVQTKLRSDMPIPEWEQMCEDFLRVYESFDGGVTPHLHAPSGFHLESYGFSKAIVDGITRRWAHDNPEFCFFTCHPGFIGSSMTKTYPGFDSLTTPERGAFSTLRLCLDDDVVKHSGGYFNEDGKLVPMRA